MIDHPETGLRLLMGNNLDGNSQTMSNWNHNRLIKFAAGIRANLSPKTKSMSIYLSLAHSQVAFVAFDAGLHLKLMRH